MPEDHAAPPFSGTTLPGLLKECHPSPRAPEFSKIPGQKMRIFCPVFRAENGADTRKQATPLGARPAFLSGIAETF
jgi:hypothetical protein